jgi:hypothetical protein
MLLVLKLTLHSRRRERATSAKYGTIELKREGAHQDLREFCIIPKAWVITASEPIKTRIIVTIDEASIIHIVMLRGIPHRSGTLP